MPVDVQQVFSQIRPELLLHMTLRPSPGYSKEFARTNACDPGDKLQLAILEMPMGQTFVPHIHVEDDQLLPRGRAQESWVVIRGCVLFSYFDLDGSKIGDAELSAGEASVSLAGGHTYEALTDNTLVYEFKTGPYFGHDLDKAPIVDGRVELRPGQRTIVS